MFKRFTKYYNNLVRSNQDQLVSKLDIYGQLVGLRNYMLEKQKNKILADIKIKTPGSPALYGYKVYSQNDEDGIIAYIFNKIPNQKTCIEIGCGNGLENNTHWLLLNGWKGVWVDGSPDNIQYIETNLNGLAFTDKLLVEQQFISLKNFIPLYQQYLRFLKAKEVDFFSIDIDGIDIYIVEQLLESGARPKVFCVEYNSKFPPPAELKVLYSDNHQWKYNDYMGASLQCWHNLMAKYGYGMVCCNAAGVNAFFVHADYENLFPRYTIQELYMPIRYHFGEERTGHKSSFSFLKNILKQQ